MTDEELGNIVLFSLDENKLVLPDDSPFKNFIWDPIKENMTCSSTHMSSNNILGKDIKHKVAKANRSKANGSKPKVSMKVLIAEPSIDDLCNMVQTVSEKTDATIGKLYEMMEMIKIMMEKNNGNNSLVLEALASIIVHLMQKDSSSSNV